MKSSCGLHLSIYISDGRFALVLNGIWYECMWIPTFVKNYVPDWDSSTDKVNVTFLFLSRFLLRSLQVDGHFLIWLLTGWRPCWQPLRNHVWKLLLAKIKFKRDHFNKANSWSDTLLNRGHMHVNHHIIYSHRLHPKNTVCNLFCLVCRQWIFPYPSGLRHWHWGNHRILPLPVK